MTILSRAKAMPLREQFEDYFADSRRNRGAKKRPNFDICFDGTYADDHTQRHWWTWQQASTAAREQIAAEGDAVIAKLCEALEAVQREFIDGHISASLWTDAQAEADLMARAALAEARKQ